MEDVFTYFTYLLLLIPVAALSHLFPSKIRVIPCVVSKQFNGLVSFHSSVVQACVYNQPHCSPNLEGGKSKVFAILQLKKLSKRNIN